MPVPLNVLSIGTLNISEYISLCPRCHHAIEVRTAGSGTRARDGDIDVCFVCPHCLKFFITSYRASGAVGPNTWPAVFLRSEPQQHAPRTFGRVDALSPQFNRVYNQAAAAEAASLDEIAGVGYRKSLEFVVKDYCISKNPTKTSEIKSKLLGQVIADYLDDGRIKEAAKRTVWLGNDETHYERRWEGKDLSDLKNLLHLTINSIEGSLEYDYYLQEMVQPGSQKSVV